LPEIKLCVKFGVLAVVSFVNHRSGQRAVAQHSVHPTGGSLRVFRQFSWLEVGSVKVALSRPAHQRVTRTVGRIYRPMSGNKLRRE